MAYINVIVAYGWPWAVQIALLIGAGARKALDKELGQVVSVASLGAVGVNTAFLPHLGALTRGTLGSLGRWYYLNQDPGLWVDSLSLNQLPLSQQASLACEPSADACLFQHEGLLACTAGSPSGCGASPFPGMLLLHRPEEQFEMPVANCMPELRQLLCHSICYCWLWGYQPWLHPE